MVESKLDCLKNCKAWCCTSRTLAFDFTDREANFMVKSGANLTFVEGTGYFMNSDCPFLRGKKCVLHKNGMQPQCCGDNRVGEELCLKIRARVFKRSEVE